MDEYAVLVFRDQPFADAEQLAFAQRLDGELHTKTGVRALQKNRFGNEALTDISNVDENGEILERDDRRRAYGLGNRLWHTDASFQDPPGRYSMLHARVVPPVAADTEFADMRAAYDALRCRDEGAARGPAARTTRSRIRARRSASSSRGEEAERLKGAVHPLVRTLPRSGRRSLYLASHARRSSTGRCPTGRLLLLDLIEHATQPPVRLSSLAGASATS